MTRSPASEPGLRTLLLANGSWALAGTAGVAASALAINALLARMMDAAEMGTYFLALSIVMPMSVIVLGGAHQAAVLMIAGSLGRGRHPEARRLVRTVSAYGIACLLVGSTGWLLAGPWVSTHLLNAHDLGRMSSLVAAWIAVSAVQLLTAELARAHHDIRLASILGGFGGALAGIVTCGVLLFVALANVRMTPGMAITLQLCSTGLITGVGAYFVVRRSRIVAYEPGFSEPQPIGRAAQVGMPFMVANIATVLIVQVDLWMVSSVASGEDVAVYGAASRLAYAIALPYTVMIAIVMPIMADLIARRQPAQLERAIRATAAAVTIPSLLGTIVFAVAGGRVLHIAFGGPYASGGAVLAILAAGQLVHVACGPAGELLLMTGHQRLQMSIYTAACAVTVIALYAVRSMGLVAIASTVTAVIVVQKLVAVVMARRLSGINTIASLWLPSRVRGGTRIEYRTET